MDISKDLKYDYTYLPPDHKLTQASGGPINDMLSPGEKLLWSGQPPGKLLVFRASDLALMPFALFWTGFSLLWEFAALAGVLSGGFDLFSLCFPLFGVPFVLIGVYLLFGRFVMDVVTRRRTYYALTDRRVFVLTTLRERNVVSMPLHKIDNVAIALHRDGLGTLTFQGDGSRAGDSRKTYYVANGVMTAGGGPMFDHIESPKKVYDMVLEAQEELWARQRDSGQRNG
ncbi:MAG: PH domain-containing protein [Methanocella sp.]